MDDADQWSIALLEAAPFGILLVNTHGQITLLNSRAEQQFGYDHHELIHADIGILLPERLRVNHQRFLLDFFANPAVRPMGIGMDLMGRRKDGSEFPIEIGLGWLEKDGNRLAVAYVTDTTGRRDIAAAEARTRQSQRMRSLDDLSTNTSTTVTASVYGSAPIRQSVPSVFGLLVERYGRLLDMALEQRAYKVDYDLSPELRDIAEQLGFMRAGPRDVVEIHTSAIRARTEDGPLARAQAYVEEGSVIVLEFMGYLVSYYRNLER